MYKALYRKWRPLVFADVVGQHHVTETLRNEIGAGRLSHAYLFTGTRGTGKTSCAKILSRAANCESPRSGDPCNECPSCRGILDGSILDVIEIDAASYSGVDNIRALRDESVYTPASVKKRVYIIDEVHMLSIGAFNALLTILEEPPPHVLFILATTETHKVPATILSRCQRFDFRRIAPKDMVAHLHKVAAGEGIELTDDAAHILTRLADGALRDALSLLDQCAGRHDNALDAEAVYDALGMAGLERTWELAEALAERDAPKALALLQKRYESGRDMSSILDELCVLLRDLLLSGYLTGARSLSGLDTNEDRTSALAARLGRPYLLYAITMIQETQGLMARGGNRRVDMELCLLRLCNERLSGDPAALEARLARLEEALANVRSSSAPPVAPPVAAPVTPAPDDAAPWEETTPDKERSVATTPPEAPPGEETKGPPVAAPPGVPGQHVDATYWEKLLAMLTGQVSMLPLAILGRARHRLTEQTLTISVESFELKNVQDKALLASVTALASDIVGHPVDVVVTTGALGEEPKPDKLAELIRRGGDVIKIEN